MTPWIKDNDAFSAVCGIHLAYIAQHSFTTWIGEWYIRKKGAHALEHPGISKSETNHINVALPGLRRDKLRRALVRLSSPSLCVTWRTVFPCLALWGKELVKMADLGISVSINLTLDPLTMQVLHPWLFFAALEAHTKHHGGLCDVVGVSIFSSVGAVTNGVSGLRPSMHSWPRSTSILPHLTNTRLIQPVGGPYLEFSTQRGFSPLHLEPISTLCRYCYDSQLYVPLLSRCTLTHTFQFVNSVQILSPHDPEAGRLFTPITPS